MFFLRLFVVSLFIVFLHKKLKAQSELSLFAAEFNWFWIQLRLHQLYTGNGCMDVDEWKAKILPCPLHGRGPQARAGNHRWHPHRPPPEESRRPAGQPPESAD